LLQHLVVQHHDGVVVVIDEPDRAEIGEVQDGFFREVGVVSLYRGLVAPVLHYARDPPADNGFLLTQIGNTATVLA
jgi:hypothetical protein